VKVAKCDGVPAWTFSGIALLSKDTSHNVVQSANN
jgi:hypothetical protein